MLPDGRRLHLSHGPIDLVIEAWGAHAEVERAYGQAGDAFGDVLPTLCRELPRLRRQCDDTPFDGPVAERMRRACRPLTLSPLPSRCARQEGSEEEVFLTPMAAVAGAVADHMLERLMSGRVLEKAYVNDGGDIAFHLSPGARLDCALVADLAAPSVDGRFALTHELPVRGLATSGRATKGEGGRSFSLGIADAVTVLATDAAAADAAATLIANAVDLPGHRAVTRVPARELDPDSDLGDRLVTVALGPLHADEIRHALAAGRREAKRLADAGRIHAAVLVLRGDIATVGIDTPRLAA
jgi:ApbE superfamily uncharacterized protein (UPF0280 family)